MTARTETGPAPGSTLKEFRADVLAGLAQEPKAISSRWFYDAAGSQLFQRIMASPDYYLTRAEDEILREQADDIVQALAPAGAEFDLFELGAGDGAKTKHLLRRALERGRRPHFRPIDISPHALRDLETSLATELPTLSVTGVVGEYLEAVQGALSDPGYPKAVLFLGSNIGNLDREHTITLLRTISAQLGSGDRLLVGFDLKKDPATIRRAYDDRDGITRDFNLNLLRRMNRELGADFQVQQFVHAPVYCPATGRAISYLVSTCDQEVRLPGAAGPVSFRAWEAFRTEISQKYDPAMIADLAAHAGLRILREFTDRDGLFSDVVFGPVPRAG
ncbi:MAG: L-histidine N(alpha)-methyltransferase [Gemmatimonadota bacterium]|nr:L-histidine N(alpha)-methyltransferase [Gemmatimonadota bacterium]